MPTPILQALGVCRAFGDHHALQDVALSVDPGEVVGFVGPNGAGKSTFLRCVVGLVDRDAGELTVQDMDPHHAGVWIRARTSYLPGETSVYRGMTGREFLRFATGFHGERNRELAADLEGDFQLPLGRKVRTYSAGMKQKLALLAALTPRVPLYLLDEPDRALDANARFILRQAVARLREDGRAVLLSSHHLEEVEASSDRLVFLFDGRIVPPERITQARRQLHRRVRLRLNREVPLPAGAVIQEQEPDGTRVLEVDGAPNQWLAQLPDDAVAAAELGMTRLEDLYRLLAEDRVRAPATATATEAEGEGRP